MSRQDAPLSIYLHIPFCRALCSYCAFNTYIELDHLIPAYMDALCAEMKTVAPGAHGRRLRSVYFGGGTPSRLSPARLDRALQRVFDLFDAPADAEISLEANPDDLNETYLRELRRCGVNRLSIGMQSADPALLRLYERRHDFAAVVDAVSCARRAGFDNISLDLIFGAPEESLADWQSSLEAALGLGVEHLSLYGLELKGGTPLRLQVDAGELQRPDDDAFADMYEHACERLDAAGYAQYEISNWRRPGFACRHNMQYWRNLEYLGLGAGAHGYAGGYRYSTVAAPGRYIESLRNARDVAIEFPLTPALAKANRVDRADELYETVMMGMRLTQEGIDRLAFARRFGCDFLDIFGAASARLEALDLLRVADERVVLSDRGRLLSNGVIRQLVDEISQPA